MIMFTKMNTCIMHTNTHTVMHPLQICRQVTPVTFYFPLFF